LVDLFKFLKNPSRKHDIPVDSDIKVSRNVPQGRGLETTASLYNASVIFSAMGLRIKIWQIFNVSCRIVCKEESGASPASQAPVGNNWTKFTWANIHAH